VSVLRSFASAEAWKIVNASADIKRRISFADRLTMGNSQARDWPVVVYDKGTKTVTRKKIGDVCSVPRLYQVPDYADQLVRAIVRLNLREDPYTLIRGFNFEALLKLGLEPLDPEWIERKSIAKLDSNFARLLPLLSQGQPFDRKQVTTLLRFIVFARYRTPLWRRQYFQEQYRHRIRSIEKQIRYLSKIAKEDLPEELRSSLDRFNEIINQHVYHVAMMRHSDNAFDPMSAIEEAGVKIKVRILHSSAATPFITCDNPARPYKPDQLRQIFDSRIPGLKELGVHILYPISPLSCVVISSNTSWRDFEHQSASVSSIKAINSALALMADEQIIFSGPNMSVFEEWLKPDQIRPLARP